MTTVRQRAGQAAIAARLRLELRRRADYDRLPDAGQAAWRTDRLAALRRYAVERSPGYRALHHGLEGAPLHELPTVTKDDVVDRFDELVTDRGLTASALRRLVDHDDPRAASGYRVAASSGSSGRPGLFPSTTDEWVQLLAAAARSRVVAGPPARPSAGAPRTARVGSPSRWHLSTQLPATLPDPRRPSLVLSAAADLDEQCRRLADWQPHVLTAYPSVLGVLAEAQLEGRLDIRPAQVFGGGERLLPAVAQRVSEAWDVRPFDQYATAEAGFVAVECGHHTGMHVLDDHVVVEVVDDDGEAVGPGVPGARVLLTVLGSRTLPLIRYELDDVATITEGPCPCGRRSARLSSVASATRSLLRLPGADGGHVTVHPVVFTSVLDHAPVRAWQVVREPERLLLLVVGPWGDFESDQLAQQLSSAMGDAGAAAVPVEVRSVDELRRAPSGKAGLVISDPEDGR